MENLFLHVAATTPNHTNVFVSPVLFLLPPDTSLPRPLYHFPAFFYGYLPASFIPICISLKYCCLAASGKDQEE